MKRILLVALALTFAAGLPSPLPAANGEGFAIVVHPENRVTTITRDELSKIFLKRLRTWQDGRRAIPVDQDPASPTRDAFSRQVHDRSVINIEVYWKRMIFSGRSVPPAELSGDAAVIAFVRATPGAVGYVDSRTDMDGVKRLRLTE